MGNTVNQLAELVQGSVLGNGDVIIRSARTLTEAGPDDITFVENDTYLPALHKSQAAGAVVSPRVPLNGKALIRVDDPLRAFVVIYQHLRGRAVPQPSGIDARAVVHAGVHIGAAPSIHALAVIGENTTVGARCQIHAGVVIGKNCRLGDDVVLYPNVVLYDDVVIGDRVILHANCVIGADGFGYRFRDNRHEKVPQLSNVLIGDDVEIGACTTIDRGAFEPTRIGAGTKVDNQVQIAHNCKIGKHNLLAAQAGIAGSCTTGDYVILAGQAGIADHVVIGAMAKIGAGAGVANDVEAGASMLGAPARPLADQRRLFASLHKLPEIRRDVERLKKHLGLKPTESNSSPQEGAQA